MMSIYDYSYTSIEGETIPLSNYKGKVLHISLFVFNGILLRSSWSTQEFLSKLKARLWAGFFLAFNRALKQPKINNCPISAGQ